MSGLRFFRSFSAEVMKTAAKIEDAEIQALLADRRGEEYLPGGKLHSNANADGPELQPKVASLEAAGLAGSGAYDNSSRKKKNNSYQKGRDYAMAGVRGGLTGLGVLGAVNTMRGKSFPVTGSNLRSAMLSARKAGGLGASAAIVDRAYRYDELPGDGKDKKAFVNPAVGGAFRSPASQLARSRATGGFKSRVVRNGGRPPRVVQLGKKFGI